MPRGSPQHGTSAFAVLATAATAAAILVYARWRKQGGDATAIKNVVLAEVEKARVAVTTAQAATFASRRWSISGETDKAAAARAEKLAARAAIVEANRSLETIRQAHAAAEEEEPDWLADAAQQMGFLSAKGLQTPGDPMRTPQRIQTPPSSPYLHVESVDTVQFERMRQSLAAAQEAAAAAQAELEALKEETSTARKKLKRVSSEISSQSPQRHGQAAERDGLPATSSLEAGATMAAAAMVLVLAVKEIASGRSLRR